MLGQLNYHKAHPEISPADYSRASRYAMGAEVLKRKRIYLDMKYWIYCLDASLGRPMKAAHKDIWLTLESLVVSERVLCPVHFAVLAEVLKQGNCDRRMQMAELIDYLSLGISVQPPERLAEIELLHLLTKLFRGPDAVLSLDQIVWQPVGNVCGELVPKCRAFDAETNAALQKSHYDVASVMTLSAIVESLGGAKDFPLLDDSELQESLTRKIQEDRNEFNTFEEVFAIEIGGILDLLGPELEDSLKYMHTSETDSSQGQDNQAAVAESVRMFTNFIYHAYRLGKLSTEFPSLHIGAGIHAAVRYQQRAFKKGDHHDHLHAQCALPYCDMFFTERALGTLLTGNLVKFDKTYNCRVLWREEDVLRELQSEMVRA